MRAKAAIARLAAGAAPKESPFEYIHSRQKHDVIGRKVKGLNVNAAQSRARGIDVRKRTLAVALAREGRSSQFVDERFGERVSGISEEDKMLGRYQLSKKAKVSARVAKFALSDDNGGGSVGGTEIGLTHLGQTLGEHNMAGWDGPDGDDEEVEDRERSLGSARFVRELNFGGGEAVNTGDSQGGERAKTRQEVMDEVIAKSRYYRAERARTKMEQAATIGRLDAEFDDIRGLLRGYVAEARTTSVSQGGDDASAAQHLLEDKYADFEVLSRELALAARSRPADRLKTEEERLEAEADRLSRLEAERKARMRGEDIGEGPAEVVARAPTDDDLGINFVLDEDERRKGNEESEGQDKGEEGEEQGDDGDEDDNGGDDDDAGDDDDDEEDSYADDGDEAVDEEGTRAEANGTGAVADGVGDDVRGATRAGASASAGRRNTARNDSGMAKAHVGDVAVSQSGDEGAHTRCGPAGSPGGSVKKSDEYDHLPYTPSAPTSAKDLQDLLALARDDPVGEQLLLNRTIACHHVKLAESNRSKMATLFELTLGRFEHLAARTPVPVRHLDALCSPLFTLCHMMPMKTAEHVKNVLAQVSKRVQKRSRRAATTCARRVQGRGYAPLDGGCLLACSELLLVKLLAQLYPTSDRRHPITTSCMVLLASACNTRAPSAVATAASCLCMLAHTALLLHISSANGANRFAPEVFTATERTGNAIARAIRALPEDSAPASESARPLGAHLLRGLVDAAAVRLGDTCGSGGASIVLDCARTWGQVAVDLSRSCEGLSAAAEALAPIEGCAKEMRGALASLGGRAPCATRELIAASDALSARRVLSARARRPLQLQRRAPVALKALEPDFDERPNLDRPAAEPSPGMRKGDREEERERREVQALRRQHKREMKSAAREIRKDAAFVATQRLERQRARDEELEEAQKKARAVLDHQEANYKTMLKERKRTLKAKI